MRRECCGSPAQTSQPLGFCKGVRNLGVSKLRCVSPTPANKVEASFYFEIAFIFHELIFKWHSFALPELGHQVGMLAGDQHYLLREISKIFKKLFSFETPGSSFVKILLCPPMGWIVGASWETLWLRKCYLITEVPEFPLCCRGSATKV